MAVAERLVERLNEYEREHAADPYANIWEDVIWPTGQVDYEATEHEDATGRSAIAVFTDGSCCRWLEDERRWVAEED